MNYGALFTGGKDSTFAMYLAKKENKRISCLITIEPSDKDSYLYHFPNKKVIELISESVNIPLIYYKIHNAQSEYTALEECLKIAKKEYKISHILNGAISSKFQKNNFRQICNSLNIELESPLWNKIPIDYLSELLANEFKIMLISVSTMGLDDTWLGRILGKEEIENIKRLSEKNQFNLNFEGGEAESLVLDCPLYSKQIKILKATPKWDGQKGIFEILDVCLVSK